MTVADLLLLIKMQFYLRVLTIRLVTTLLESFHKCKQFIELITENFPHLPILTKIDIKNK